jgi:regulation of enolase protein 1 (concanavalin A-like superfamily)
MRRTICLVVVLLAACLLRESARAGEKKTQTVAGWGTVVDPDGDCRVQEDKEKGRVTITVPKTYHDLTYKGDEGKLNAPRVVQPVEGDFRLQILVDAFQLPKDEASSGGGAVFVSSGLLVWADDKNFMRFERASGGAAPVAFVELFENGHSASQETGEIADRPTYLRVTRAGNLFTFEASQDGKEWTEVHSAERKLPRKLQVGVLAINTTTREFSPRLEGLKLGPR